MSIPLCLHLVDGLNGSTPATRHNGVPMFTAAIGTMSFGMRNLRVNREDMPVLEHPLRSELPRQLHAPRRCFL